MNRWMLAVLLLSCALSGILLLANDPAPNFVVCVTNERSGTVTLIDGKEQKVLRSLEVGRRPRAVHSSPDGQRLYVALSGSPMPPIPKLVSQPNRLYDWSLPQDSADHSADGIRVVDLVREQAVGRLWAGSDPEEFAITPNGKQLFVANADADTVSIVRVDNQQIEQLLRVERAGKSVAIDPAGKQVFITCENTGQLAVFDAASGKAVGQIYIGGRPRAIAFLPDGSRAVVASEGEGAVSIIDVESLLIVHRVALPSGSRPLQILPTQDGQHFFVSNGPAGSISLLRSEDGALVDNILVGAHPRGLGLSPDGKFLFVANSHSNDVSVIELARRKEISRIACGDSPWGIAIALTHPLF
jgi:YVTN family beta-propeller protein